MNDEHDCIQRERIASLETETRIYKDRADNMEKNLVAQIFNRIAALEIKQAIMKTQVAMIAGVFSLVGGIIGALIGKYLMK